MHADEQPAASESDSVRSGSANESRPSDLEARLAPRLALLERQVERLTAAVE
jgi:hypothetical protein